MLYSSFDIKTAAKACDKTQFMADIRRHDLPIEGRNFAGRKAYSLTDIAVALLIGRLRDYEVSLTSCRRLLERIDRNLLRDYVDQFAANEIDDVIVLIPSLTNLDDEFPTIVTSWADVVRFATAEGIDFIPFSLGESIRDKLDGYW